MKERPAPATVLKQLLYTPIFLTQIENGSRIFEDVEAVLNFKDSSERIQKVRARRHKKKINHSISKYLKNIILIQIFFYGGEDRDNQSG